jgi:hypothetical protein
LKDVINGLSVLPLRLTFSFNITALIAKAVGFQNLANAREALTRAIPPALLLFSTES